MPAKGLTLTDVPPDVAEMFRTHETARELGAPDLAESKTFGRDLLSGKASEATLTRSSALARGMTRAAMARKSLRARPVDGYFIRCGHQKSAENTYTDAKGVRCRECRNAWKRSNRTDVKMAA